VSLFFQTRCIKKFEIVFGDNGLSDVGVGFVREYDPSLKKIIETGKTLGFAGGSNAGIRIAKGGFILSLNNDTIEDPYFLEGLQEPFPQDPRRGIARVLHP